MENVYKRQIPVFLTFLVGTIIVLDYFWSDPLLNSAKNEITSWGTILALFAVYYSSTLIFRKNINAIIQKKEKWYLSAWLLIVSAMFIIVGLSQGSQSALYQNIFDGFLQSVTSTLWGISALYMASAYYRGVKVKNIAGTLLFLGAILLTLSQIPIGPATWNGFATIGDWILKYPSTAGNRGFVISAAFGAFILGLRVISGRESKYLGEEAGE